MSTTAVSDRARPAALAASLFLVGLVTGIFVSTELGQVRVQNTLDARDFTLVKSRFEIALGTVMPPAVVIAGISLVATLLTTWRVRRSFVLCAAALVLWIGVVVTTLVFNAPVNALAVNWDPAQPPPDWAALRDQWNTGQRIRTVCALAAFAGLAAAATSPWPDRVHAVT